MLSGLIQIGKAIGATDIEEYLRNKVITKDLGEDAKIIQVRFKPNEKRIELISEEFDKSRLYKYLWVGNTKGSEPPKRLTTTDFFKLLTQAIPNIYEIVDNGPLKEALGKILEQLGCEKSERGKKTKRVVDFSYLQDASEELKQLWTNLNDLSDKKAVQELQEAIVNYLRQKFELSKKGLASIIFTAYLDDTPLVSFPEYRVMLYNEFVQDAFEDAIDGVCHGCGKVGKVTSNFQKIEMKFFITDKISFASNLKKEQFYKNYTLCSDCYVAFSSAEKFIKNYMQTKFSRVPYKCYVIPEFLFDTPLPIESFRDRAMRMLNVTETLNYSDKWNEFRKEVEDLLDSSSFLLNYVFVEESNAAVKIKKIITDVPPSRIKQVIREREATFERFKNLIDPFETASRPVSRLDFDRILYLFPVRKERPNNILEIYDSILTGKHLDARKLINDFVEVITIHYYSKYNSYVHKEQKNEDQVIFSVIDHIIDSNQFLYYAEKLGIIE
ncbi:TM1802 family CRISPR-associated protein, partial [Fervidobacterium thailandense]